MRVSIVRGLIAVLGVSGLVACGGEEKAPPPPASRPVKIFVVEGGGGESARSYPGRVDASQRAELSFRVAGRLKELLVKEGDRVEEGQVLARLDPTDYKIVLEDRQASFDNAKSNFSRAKELVKDGNISRMDYDRMEAAYRSASAALSQAKQDLEYTVLNAPFKGRIAQRNVENFEEVLAKQTVFTLQNTDSLDVIIDLPESVVRSLRASTGGKSVSSGPIRDRVHAYAEFEGHAEQFPLQPKEIATKADEKTQTFRATLTMAAPTEFTVLPGMTAKVVLDLSELAAQTTSTATWVPVRAVQGDEGLNPRVWVLDPATMTVSSRPVTVGRMSGRSIEVTGGLKGGDEIVAVGAPYLAEGMHVTRMQQPEQAEPRADDPV